MNSLGFSALNEISRDKESNYFRESFSSNNLNETSEEKILNSYKLLQQSHSCYNQALVLYGQGNFEAAIDKFLDVLHSKYITKDEFSFEDPRLKLKFNSLKYLGLYHLKKKQYKKCLFFLIEAFKVDSHDFNICFKIAISSFHLGNYHINLSILALENGFQLSPNNCETLGLLLNVTFVMKNYELCLYYILVALKRNQFCDKSLKLKNHILTKHPHLESIYPKIKESIRKNNFLSCKSYFRTSQLHINPENIPKIVYIGSLNYAEFLKLVLEKKNYRHVIFVNKISSVPVQVSIQNCSQKIVDILTISSTPRIICKYIVEEVIDMVLIKSPLYIVSSTLNNIIQTILNDLPYPLKSIKRTNSNEFPLDLLETRKSSRVKNFNYSSNNHVEANIQDILENFIPSILKKNQLEFKKTSLKTSSKDILLNNESNLKYFPTDREEELNIKSLVEKINSNEYINVVYQVLNFFVNIKAYSWTKEFKRNYISLYILWRKCFIPPDYVYTEEKFSFLKIFILANELILTKKNCLDKTIHEFVKDDLFILQNIFPNLAKLDRLRISYLLFQFYVKDEVEEDRAYMFGNIFLNILLENDNLLPSEWVIAGIKPNAKSMYCTLSCLKNTKTLNKVQIFFEKKEYHKVSSALSHSIDLERNDNNKDDTWLLRLFMLIESLWNLKDYTTCLSRCALALTNVILKENIFDINNILSYVYNCLELLDFNKMVFTITEATYSSLFSSLQSILLNQVKETLKLKSSKPWVIFYKLISFIERSHSNLDENGIPQSVHFLISAHVYIGKLSLCINDSGEFLHILIETLVPFYRDKSLSSFIIDSIKLHLDQAMYCLYSHPSKKNRAKHLLDHGVNPLALTWSKCPTLFKVVKPYILPEYDDFKQSSITSEIESLLKRISSLVPKEFSLDERIQKVKKYFLSDLNSFPFFENSENFPHEMVDIFFLLGDYYFKNSDFKQSMHFLHIDLSFNCKRLDSYIELALASANEFEETLAQTYSRNIREVLKNGMSVLNIFKECFKKSKKNPSIYIEGANFAFSLNAYCSRLMKGEVNSLTLELFTLIENSKSIFLDIAESWYSEALNIQDEIFDSDVDERWLVYFFRGKIFEKRNKPIDECLMEYMKAIKNLISQGEYIPKKIHYSLQSGNQSQELLELYYRFHASLLKYEIRNDFQLSDSLLESITNIIKDIDNLNVFKDPSKKRSINECDIPMEKTLKNYSRPMTSEEISIHCINSLEVVKNTYHHHYKSLHILASFFLAKHPYQSAIRAKEYLLNTIPGVKSPTLFGDRKATNLFSGIWKSPVNEFERPGSFPTHVGKCLNVFFQVLRETEDYSIFLEAIQILKKSAEGDRKYLFEKDRINYYTEACTCFDQILISKIDKLSKELNTVGSKLRFMIELYSFLKSKKQIPKQSCDRIHATLKSMYYLIFKHNVTNDQVIAFVKKISSKEINLSKEEELTKLLCECSNLVKNNNGQWIHPEFFQKKVAKSKSLPKPLEISNIRKNKCSGQKQSSLTQKIIGIKKIPNFNEVQLHYRNDKIKKKSTKAHQEKNKAYCLKKSFNLDESTLSTERNLSKNEVFTKQTFNINKLSKSSLRKKMNKSINSKFQNKNRKESSFLSNYDFPQAQNKKDLKMNLSMNVMDNSLGSINSSSFPVMSSLIHRSKSINSELLVNSKSIFSTQNNYQASLPSSYVGSFNYEPFDPSISLSSSLLSLANTIDNSNKTISDEALYKKDMTKLPINNSNCQDAISVLRKKQNYKTSFSSSKPNEKEIIPILKKKIKPKSSISDSRLYNFDFVLNKNQTDYLSSQYSHKKKSRFPHNELKYSANQTSMASASLDNNPKVLDLKSQNKCIKSDLNNFLQKQKNNIISVTSNSPVCTHQKIKTVKSKNYLKEDSFAKKCDEKIDTNRETLLSSMKRKCSTEDERHETNIYLKQAKKDSNFQPKEKKFLD